MVICLRALYTNIHYKRPSVALVTKKPNQVAISSSSAARFLLRTGAVEF
jgi:hypothetical protein